MRGSWGVSLNTYFTLDNMIYYKEGYLRGLVEARLSVAKKACTIYLCTRRLQLINKAGDDIEFDKEHFYIWGLIETELIEFYKKRTTSL